jgi:phage-related protein
MRRIVFRRLHWIGSSRRDFDVVPVVARDRLWLALVFARIGEKYSSARALGGCGDAGILEVATEHDGFVYWLVYSACYVDTVYVLHCSWQHPGEYKYLHAVRTALQEVRLFKRGGWHE